MPHSSYIADPDFETYAVEEMPDGWRFVFFDLDPPYPETITIESFDYAARGTFLGHRIVPDKPAYTVITRHS